MNMDVNKTGNVYLIEKNGNNYDIVLLTESGKSKTVLKEVSSELKFIRCNNNGKLVVTDYNNHIYISTDNGNSWQEKTTPPGIVFSIILNSDEIFISIEREIIKSSDNGNTWETIHNDEYTGLLLQASANKIYTATTRSLNVSYDNGLSWTTIWSIGENNLNGIVRNVSADNNGSIFLCVNNGLFKITPDDSLKYIGISDEIIDAASIGDIIFAASSILYKHDPATHPYLGKNYFPLHIGNWWQCLVDYNVKWSSPYYLLNYYINKDTMIDNKTYYIMSNNINNDQQLYRYDNINQRAYQYIDNEYQSGESLFMDFNLIEGDSLGDNHIIMGADKFFGHTFNYKGLYSYIFNWIYEYETYSCFYENIGYLRGTDFLQCNLVYQDSTVLYTYNYSPEIEINPKDTVTSTDLDLNFVVNHHLSLCDTISFRYYFNYIDTVLLKSRYIKQNSIINNPDTVLTNKPNYFKYGISVNLDTALIKQGYDFCYRIEAKDKGIIPHYSYFPDTGYYKVAYHKLTGVKEDDLVDRTFYVAQNYPNPFNPTTTIVYELPSPTDVSIEIFDVLGRKVQTLLSEKEDSGIHTLQWDAKKFAGGVYFCRIKAERNIKTIKMSLIK